MHVQIPESKLSRYVIGRLLGLQYIPEALLLDSLCNVIFIIFLHF